MCFYLEFLFLILWLGVELLLLWNCWPSLQHKVWMLFPSQRTVYVDAFFSWLGFGRMCLMLTWWPCVPTSVDHPRRPGSHNICHHHLKFKRKYWLIFITVFNGIFELSMNSFFYFFIILWRSSLFYNGYFLIFGRIWELVVFQCLTTLPVVFSASSCVLSFEQIKPFMWIMCIRGYWCLLFQNISFKNGLVAKRMNLWAWNCFLSSQARVTSVHLISSLISLNDELMFFWKSFKLRQNFPDTWDMFLKSCLVWTSWALSLLDQTFQKILFKLTSKYKSLDF